ncbi:hypothetical protein OG337_28685 [[Kitasatospora] papulosa]|uniref:hypothetical protein n=1 Tax=[Kitasatospora] papulosa TaxID=1464011 RepID=UPI00386E523B|nr:hypothetical protein OG337_28685 [[Kitasatospora] papulosa]
MSTETPLAAHLAGLAAAPFVPELHTDDCNDVACLACKGLTAASLPSVDAWLDRLNVFAKQYRENVEGELIVTGLRVGERPNHVVARFGDAISVRYNGGLVVRTNVVDRGELTSAEWNAKHPVGTRVRAYPGVYGEDGFTTWTTSRAWTLGGHTPVATVEGYSGGIALTHLDVIEEDAS